MHVGRLALLGFCLLLMACGSHAESGVTSVDPLLAVERDPQAALAAAQHPTYKATYELTFSSLYASAPPGAASLTYTQQMLLSLNESPLDMLQSSAKDMDVTVLPRERIAGRDGACFRWQTRPRASATASPNPLLGQLGDVKLEACFSADGVMLRTLTSSGSLFSAEQRATSVSGTVTDADFALPYPLTSAPFSIPTSAPITAPTPRPTPKGTPNPNPTR